LDSDNYLMHRLDRVISAYRTNSILFVTLAAIILIGRFFLQRISSGGLGEYGKWMELFDSIFMCIILVVLSYPTILKFMLKYGLYYASKTMEDEDNIVNNLNAIEAMGRADIVALGTRSIVSRETKPIAFWNEKFFEFPKPSSG